MTTYTEEERTAIIRAMQERQSKAGKWTKKISKAKQRKLDKKKWASLPTEKKKTRAEREIEQHMKDL